MSDINVVKITGTISATDEIKLGSVSSNGLIVGENLPFSYQSIKLLPATRSRLGGVIIGENVDVTEDGTISVEAPRYLDNAEFLSKFD